jgi:hypothetical protein
MSRRIRIKIDLSAPCDMPLGLPNREWLKRQVTDATKDWMCTQVWQIDVGEDYEEIEPVLDGVTVSQDAPVKKVKTRKKGA